jgi:predicted unusual protein kinase regulating ubiquinone biosynthesis (AarF/ABC1/UbiB family)
MSKKNRRPMTSPMGRLVKLGGLAGRVGASVLGERAAEIVRLGPAKEIKRTESLVKNAIRVVETLGEMKGAAMKVGQMLSLQIGMLPPEVAEVLRALQQQAPRVPSEVMRYEVEGSLGAPIDELFAEFEEEAFAAASIGQVHRGKLHDGRRVAIKIQYPLIREVVRADLKNLKTVMKSLFSMIFDADFEPLWQEMHDVLLEELDYEHEAANLKRMQELHSDVPDVVIPAVVEELSSDRILTMEYVEGVSAERACSDEFTQLQRDRWGVALFELEMRGLFEHRLMHADPNLANFSFCDDGRIIVYDFGCLKRVPDRIAEGYAHLVLAALEDRRAEIPEILADIGLVRASGEAMQLELIDPYIDLFAEMLREDPPYAFGEDDEFYDKIMELGMANWSQATDLRFPEDIIFIDRTLAGHFGNLIRLSATGPWRRILQYYAQRFAVQNRDS